MAHVPRLYVPSRLGPGPLRLDGAQAKRLASVMRLREGDRFFVFGGDGREWEAVVAGTTRAGVAARVEGLSRQEPQAALVVEVWCALVRPQRFDWAVEKCTETGADIIRPLLSEHTVRGEGGSKARQERWQRIAVEAAEQSGRLWVPVVEPPAGFDDLLKSHRGPLVVCHWGGKAWAEIEPLLPPAGRLALAIGPEGGFSDEEVARARASGALVASLGPHVLRTETAAVLAAALARSTAR
jgi:16S rRNA (uracil1498-N3)-methyltransferase